MPPLPPEVSMTMQLARRMSDSVNGRPKPRPSLPQLQLPTAAPVATANPLQALGAMPQLASTLAAQQQAAVLAAQQRGQQQAALIAKLASRPSKTSAMAVTEPGPLTAGTS